MKDLVRLPRAQARSRATSLQAPRGKEPRPAAPRSSRRRRSIATRDRQMDHLIQRSEILTASAVQPESARQRCRRSKIQSQSRCFGHGGRNLHVRRSTPRRSAMMAARVTKRRKSAFPAAYRTTSTPRAPPAKRSASKLTSRGSMTKPRHKELSAMWRRYRASPNVRHDYRLSKIGEAAAAGALMLDLPNAFVRPDRNCGRDGRRWMRRSHSIGNSLNLGGPLWRALRSQRKYIRRCRTCRVESWTPRARRIRLTLSTANNTSAAKRRRRTSAPIRPRPTRRTIHMTLLARRLANCYAKSREGHRADDGMERGSGVEVLTKASSTRSAVRRRRAQAVVDKLRRRESSTVAMSPTFRRPAWTRYHHLRSEMNTDAEIPPTPMHDEVIA